MRFDPAQRFGLRLTLIGVALFLVAVPFSTLLYQVLDKGSLTRFDGGVADDVNAWMAGRRWVVDGLQGLSLLGRAPVLITLVLGAMVFMWRRGSRRLTLFLATVPLGGAVLNTMVKVAVDRPRPAVDHPVTTAFGKSFPSGHAMTSTVTYGAIVLVLLPVLPFRWRRPAVATTVVLVLAIGGSRILLGVHFVTDVVGGFALGLAWLAGAVALFEIWRAEEHRRPVDPIHEGLEPDEAEELRHGR